MIYQKLIVFFCLFASLNTSHAQETTQKKWQKGYVVGFCYNKMTTVATEDVNTSNFFQFGNVRTWNFQPQAGAFVGAYTKRKLGDRFSMQFEGNFVWSRQKTDFSEKPSSANTNQFQTRVETEGPIAFDNIYLQVPFILGFRVDNATTLELGFYITGSVINSNTQKLTSKTFTEFTNLGQFITLTPPRVTTSTEKPYMSTAAGWLFGVHHEINANMAVRLRYEGGLTGISRYFDLRESRLSAGVIFNAR